MSEDMPPEVYVQLSERLVDVPKARFNVGRWSLKQYKELVAAIQFLSSMPVPGSVQLFQIDKAEPDLIIGSAYFPLVGLLIGGLLCLLPLLGGLYLPPLVLAALLVILQVLLTGGLHLDGLMDSCDGLFGGMNRERRLEIMRDSRLGSFGVLGGVCVLLLKFSLFGSLSIHVLVLSFLLVVPVTRWAVVLAVRSYPSARSVGLGAAFKRTVSLRRLSVAGIISLGSALIVGHLAGLVVWLVGSLMALVIGAWVTRRLGGLTGDIYGAIVEITEVVALLVLVVLRFWV